MKKRNFRLFLCVALCILLTVQTVAWFAVLKKQISSQPLTIVNPPIIFVNDYEGQDNPDTLNMEGLTVGDNQEYYIVFSVVPKKGVDLSTCTVQIAFTGYTGATLDLFKVNTISATQPTQGAYCEKTIDGTVYYYAYDTMLTADSVKVHRPEDGNRELTQADTKENTDVTYQRYIGQSLKNNNYGGAGWVVEKDPFDPEDVLFYVLRISWDHVPENLDPKQADMIYVMALEAVRVDTSAIDNES